MTLFSFDQGPQWGSTGPIFTRPPKTTSNNNEPIAIKFDVEIFIHTRDCYGLYEFENFF